MMMVDHQAMVSVVQGRLSRISSSAAIQTLLYDLFLTPDAAPLTTPRTCEPGPGSLEFTAGATGGSIADGAVVISNDNLTARSVDTYERVNGLAFWARAAIPGNGQSLVIGASANGTSISDGLNLRASSLTAWDAGSSVFLVGANGAMEAEILVIYGDTNAYVFLGNGLDRKWTLRRVLRGTKASSYRWFAQTTGALSGFLKGAGVFRLPTFNESALAIYTNASQSAAHTLTASNQVVLDVTWTPAPGETLELYVRQVDASNRYILRCVQSTGEVSFIRVSSGSETSLQSSTQTLTAGVAVRLVLTAIDDQFLAFLGNTAIVNRFQTAHGHATIVGTNGATALAFNVYYAHHNFDIPAPVTKRILAIGDSKTWAAQWQGYFVQDRRTSDGTLWSHMTIAHSGFTVANMASVVNSELANETYTPAAICINLGSNDVLSLPAESTWKANYRLIIEACHTKWPTAPIYLAKPVRLSGNPPSTPLAAVATMHGYIDALVAEYDYVYPGIDETQLENGDGYATYLSDVTHPNAVGYARCAELWGTALGY